MKKIGIVLGAAAIATLAGCKDPSYNSKWNKKPQEVKNVPVEEGQTAVKPVETAAKPADKVNETPVVIETIEPKGCTCPAGAKHTEPCACGAADCRCEVVALVDIIPGKARKFLDEFEWKDAAAYETHEELCARDDIL